MKQAVSISIGSSKRNKTVDIQILGETIRIERRGTDGDMEAATRLYTELDGTVDAFGVGGCDLGLMVARKWYPLYSIHPLVRNVHQTPLVDGTGLKTTLEGKVTGLFENELKDRTPNRRCFVMTAVDRWGLTQAFIDLNFDCIYGDLLFSLGLPIPVRKEKTIRKIAKVLMPILGRMPFSWLYPVGKEQEKRTPKYEEYFQWAEVIAGDCHYITRYMPERLDGKIIVTNTTTPEDRELFRNAGVKTLVTTTPVFEGRSFGTNMMEAAIVAATGWNKPINYAQPDEYFQMLADVVEKIPLKPQIQELN